MHTLVFATDRPARIEDYGAARRSRRRHRAAIGGTHRRRCADPYRESTLGRHRRRRPVRADSLPADTEYWLAGFTELVAAAIANAEAQAALTASRARIVAAADTARHRIERDLHDGAQQRLVTLALQFRAAQAAVPPDAGELATELERLADGPRPPGVTYGNRR